MELVKTNTLISAFGLAVAFVVVIAAMLYSLFVNRSLVNEIPLVGYSPKITYTENAEQNFTSQSNNYGLDGAKVAGAQSYDSEVFVRELDNSWVVLKVRELRLDYLLEEESIFNDPVLDSTAQIYANELASTCSKLSHSDLDSFLKLPISNGTIFNFAENLAADSSVFKAYLLLENSQQHFNNMVGNFSAFGVGIAKSQNPKCNGRVFIVQHYANT